MRQKKESRDQGDDLDGTRARIAIRRSRDEKREHAKGEQSGHGIACL